MKLLLDTHVLLWWLDDHPRLGFDARRAIADRQNQVYVSAASVWEASIKEAKGLLRLSEDFDAKLAAEPMLPKVVTHEHGRKAAALPFLHKDPFGPPLGCSVPSRWHDPGHARPDAGRVRHSAVGSVTFHAGI